MDDDTTRKEVWKPIPTYEGTYEASTWGRIRSVPRVIPDSRIGQKRIKGFIMKQTDAKDGRLVVNLRRGYKSNTMKVHRVIMLTFVGPRPEGMEICHNDGNYRNNRLDNLRYDTSSSNSYDLVKHGTHHLAKRDACQRGHKFKGDNLRVAYREDGRFKQRFCIACCRTHSYLRNHPDLRPYFQQISDSYYQSLVGSAT